MGADASFCFKQRRGPSPVPLMGCQVLCPACEQLDWLFLLVWTQLVLPVCSRCRLTPPPMCLPKTFPGAPRAADFSLQTGHLKQLPEQDTPAPMTDLSGPRGTSRFRSSLDCHMTPWVVHLAAHMSPERLCPLGLGCCLCLATAMGARHGNCKRQQHPRALKEGEKRGERRRGEEMTPPARPPCPKDHPREPGGQQRK